MLVTTLLVFLFVGSILYTIVKNGWGAMNWEMISSLPGGGFYIGKEGGLLNAIVGSLYIVGASTVLGLAVSIPVVFYLNIYLKKNSKRGSFARLAYDVLFGIPSIVYGAFAFTIMIYLGLKTSLAGGDHVVLGELDDVTLLRVQVGPGMEAFDKVLIQIRDHFRPHPGHDGHV